MAARDDVERILTEATAEHFSQLQAKLASVPPPDTNMGFDGRSPHDRFIKEVLFRYDRYPVVRASVCRIVGVPADEERQADAVVVTSDAARRSAEAAEKSAATAQRALQMADKSAADSRASRRWTILAAMATIAMAVVTISNQIGSCASEPTGRNVTTRPAP